MLAHVSIQVADVDASAAFYAAVFASLGVHEVMRVPRQNGAVVGPAGQDDVHTAALMAGAEILHEPRRWPEYFPGYYAVFLRDPDGNNVEAMTALRPE